MPGMRYGLSGLLLLSLSLPALANDVVSVRQITLDLATDIATAAVKACREQGYQVSAVVVDRNGFVQIAMRDTLAARFTLQIAEEKANLAVMAGTPSGQFRSNRADIRPELNHIDGLIVMTGGLPIQAAGSLIGALGVSGAPGGERDEACAVRALAVVQERLDFAE